MMIYFFLWLVCGILGAVIGAEKYSGEVGFVLGILFGPLGVLIILFSAGKGCLYCRKG